MSDKMKYKIQRVPRSHSPIFRWVVLPFVLVAFLIVSLGIYTFVSANRIMREDPKSLDDFANNILPAYSIASFRTLDGLTALEGWYFPAKSDAVSTVILVHGHGSNRLLFDVDTASLYDYFVERGFNVLSFDLRHSGNSDGTLSTFGYAESRDVIAAISYVRKVSATKDVILYGFGSGCSACILAMEALPAASAGTSGDAGGTDAGEASGVDFDRSYIRGLILDTPSLSSDDPIREVCRSSVFWGESIGQYTIPFAVRMSAEAGRATNLAAVIARTQIPVHMIYAKSEDPLSYEQTAAFAAERRRLYPSLTTTYSITAETGLSPFAYDSGAYLESIEDYLARFID